jgi:hypothetical protein
MVQKVRLDGPHPALEPLAGATVIDLNQSELNVVAPLAHPNRIEMRLDRELMVDALWDGP